MTQPIFIGFTLLFGRCIDASRYWCLFRFILVTFEASRPRDLQHYCTKSYTVQEFELTSTNLTEGCCGVRSVRLCKPSAVPTRKVRFMSTWRRCQTVPGPQRFLR